MCVCVCVCVLELKGVGVIYESSTTERHTVTGGTLAIVRNTWPPSVFTTSRDELENTNIKSRRRRTSNTLADCPCSPALGETLTPSRRRVFIAKQRAETKARQTTTQVGSIRLLATANANLGRWLSWNGG